MSLRVKLIAFFLLVGVVPLAVIGILSYNMAQQNIRDEVYSGLEMYSILAEEANEKMISQATEPLFPQIQSNNFDFFEITSYVNYLGNPVLGAL